MSLDTKTILVSLNCSQWAAQKFDKNVTIQTNNTHGAKSDAGRFNKHLINKQALKNIQTAVNEARTYHHNNTLDWSESTGTRILPLKKIPTYSAYMRQARREFDRSVESFLGAYPRYVENARERLGDMFDILDFPPVETIAEKFKFEHRFTPVPTSGDFRIDIPQADLMAIKTDLQSRLDHASVHATADLHQRASHTLGALYATLAVPSRRVFRTTVHENLVILTEQIRDMNFEEDAKLNQVSKYVSDNLLNISPEMLKDNDAFRQECLQKADTAVRMLNDAKTH